jgi:hypothetical protein
MINSKGTHEWNLDTYTWDRIPADRLKSMEDAKRQQIKSLRIARMKRDKGNVQAFNLKEVNIQE